MWLENFNRLFLLLKEFLRQNMIGYWPKYYWEIFLWWTSCISSSLETYFSVLIGQFIALSKVDKHISVSVYVLWHKKSKRILPDKINDIPKTRMQNVCSMEWFKIECCIWIIMECFALLGPFWLWTVLLNYWE